MADLNELTALIEPQAKALGFDLVRVILFGSGEERTLQVMAERPDTRQLTIDDCAALSRRISDLFDEVDPIEEAYRLEVSSPGIDRPLTRLSDFADWAEHEAKVMLGEGVDGRKSFNGTIEGVEGEGVESAFIRFYDRKAGQVALPFDDIVSAKLLLTDRLIASTRPLEADGVDEFDTDDTDTDDLADASESTTPSHQQED